MARKKRVPCLSEQNKLRSPGYKTTKINGISKDKRAVSCNNAKKTQLTSVIYGFLVSKETAVLRRWERSKQKFGFIKRVDKG